MAFVTIFFCLRFSNNNFQTSGSGRKSGGRKSVTKTPNKRKSTTRASVSAKKGKKAAESEPEEEEDDDEENENSDDEENEDEEGGEEDSEEVRVYSFERYFFAFRRISIFVFRSFAGCSSQAATDQRQESPRQRWLHGTVRIFFFEKYFPTFSSLIFFSFSFCRYLFKNDLDKNYRNDDKLCLWRKYLMLIVMVRLNSCKY